VAKDIRKKMKDDGENQKEIIENKELKISLLN
jgi:hypothetical protein